VLPPVPDLDVQVLPGEPVSALAVLLDPTDPGFVGEILEELHALLLQVRPDRIDVIHCLAEGP
jgi:hypothetical protein